MSRTVIRDIVIPIVSKILGETGYPTPHRRVDIRDKHLEDFLEEELRRRFGVIGANGCQHLRDQIEEAERNDPYAFEFNIRELVDRYVKLAIKLRHAKNLKKVQEGPPDRFSELRKRYKLLNQHP